MVPDFVHGTWIGRGDKNLDDTPEKLYQRNLRQERREKRANELLQKDETIQELEEAAIVRSKSVDSAVIGNYTIWKREYGKQNNIEEIIGLMQDQNIMTRVYASIAKMKNKLVLREELETQLSKSLEALEEASIGVGLPERIPDMIRAMGQVLSRANEQLYECKLVTGKLRAMLHTADEELAGVKTYATFLSQLAAKTLPDVIHCLSMRLNLEYYLLPPEMRKFPRKQNLEDPDLHHYAIFSDNVVATSVVVNSTIMNTQDTSRHVFHLVTDELNFGAMSMWFILNPPGKATIEVQSVDNFTWLNSSYCPVLRQIESAAMKEFYFKTERSESVESGTESLKYRNPKYLSMLNHLRFYLPEIFPKLEKILFLDDDVVVQRDLSALWSVDLTGKVNGAVETCGASFHRFDTYLNFTDPRISSNFDPQACGWAYGMNIFDLKEWKKNNITDTYHYWQNLNGERRLWKLGSLPPGLITFYNLTKAIEKKWHLLGLGYDKDIDLKEVENSAVIHYNGHLKPWTELAIPKYLSYWANYFPFHHPYLRACALSL
ncbi:PREDICTED: putative galacturonosyltransferase 2 [Tarenaya hassleriana]|uniref:putative galacturonosyltransferase 2 n=1 Tax=Tarenaya hassleriana TaxID=28532 RepID=UPI00053CA25A|nr:PREDICTED: putative galacturonosyltransferase 2 [Tarenaya hassleriana]